MYQKYFFIVYLIVLLISFCCSVYSFKSLPGPLKLFVLILGVTVLIEYTSFFIMFYKGKGRSMVFLYHFYVPIFYSLSAYIYANYMQTKWKKKLILFTIPVFVLVSAGLSYFVQGFTVMNTYAAMIMAILIVTLSLLYYFELLKEETLAGVNKKPLFWISTGNLIFYAGFFFLMGFMNFLNDHAPELGKKLMMLNYFLNCILYSLYSIGFLCTIPARRTSVNYSGAA